MIDEELDHLKKLLEQIFGFSSFTPGQLEIIETILAKRNVLAVMPTGAVSHYAINCLQFTLSKRPS